MRNSGLKWHIARITSNRVVKFGVAGQSFRGDGIHFQEVVFGTGELQVLLSAADDSTWKVAIRFVSGDDF
jgi:hypothetical protein